MVRLYIVSGPGAGTEHRLEGGRVSIGRDPANTIVLEDSLVSKRHAEILREPDGSMRIVDVGSSNGTVVNDRQVVDHRLSHNDRIQLGESLFRFESEPEHEAVDEGAKTVLIDEAATCLAIPAEAVQAALLKKAAPPPPDASPMSTIYISDDDGSARAAAATPPAAETPGPGPAQMKKTTLPVMPILLVFIAVMIVLGCLLTWKVVQRSSSAADGAPAMEPAAVGGMSEGLELQAVPVERTELVEADVLGAGASTPAEEENLIAEPLVSGTPVEQEPWVDNTAAQGGQAAAPPPVTRTTTPPATRTVTPPPATTTPPPARTYTPPPATTTPPPARTYTPPPTRPSEVPPAAVGQTGAGSAAGGAATAARTAAPPPAVPAQPREVVPDAAHGVLHVITKPEGAAIYINEELVGQSNLKKRMSAGKYIIRIESQGQSVTDDVKVKVQEVSTFYHDFVPPPATMKDEDEDEDKDDKDRKKKDKDKEDDEEDEEDEEDEDGEKKEKKGFKKRLKDIFG